MKGEYNIKDELVQAIGTKLGTPNNPEEAAGAPTLRWTVFVNTKYTTN